MNNSITAPNSAKPYPLSVIKQAIALCWTEALNLVPVVWGPPGFTKSATINSLARDLNLPVFDVRVSDKEPTDLSGIPFPADQTFGEGKDARVIKVLSYLANCLLPWADLHEDGFPCVLFLDEIDRASLDVLNVALQILLDRGVNGRKLSSGCRIVCAGNGATDTGTTELTSAAATRLVHFYVKTDGPGALEHWREWAQDSAVDPALIGFSGFRPEVFGCRKWDYLELQAPNPRTFTWASKAALLYDEIPVAAGVPLEVRDAIVHGLVGQAAGLEYLAYRRVLASCATFEEVVGDPDTATLPPDDNIGVTFALGSAFLSRLHDVELAKAEPGNPAAGETDPKWTAAVARYFRRIVENNSAAREAAGWWFTTASSKLASLRSTPEFRWIESGKIGG